MHVETITDLCYSYSIQREGGRQFKEVASTPRVKERGLITSLADFRFKIRHSLNKYSLFPFKTSLIHNTYISFSVTGTIEKGIR